ncbi:hypothetical protein F5Y06DRAFT_11106 [Hypoxylon sp. FL0890]|nr:hypothetical protein F5Y06DRAFT_11106 [Hypoxylon sp. FL0890]
MADNPLIDQTESKIMCLTLPSNIVVWMVFLISAKVDILQRIILCVGKQYSGKINKYYVWFCAIKRKSYICPSLYYEEFTYLRPPRSIRMKFDAPTSMKMT